MWQRMFQPSMIAVAAVAAAVSWAISWVVVFHFGVRFDNFIGGFEMDSNSSFLYLLVLLATGGPIVLLFGSVFVGELVIRPLRARCGNKSV